MASYILLEVERLLQEARELRQEVEEFLAKFGASSNSSEEEVSGEEGQGTVELVLVLLLVAIAVVILLGIGADEAGRGVLQRLWDALQDGGALRAAFGG